MSSAPFHTRFAPSPTGWLHLGHAFAALTAFQKARESGGRFLIRLEDIDGTRARPEFEEAIYEDLHWLGLQWETPVRRQSSHFADYQSALNQLSDRGLLYPCFCTRREILDEVARSSNAPQGPDGALYPGLCRHRSEQERADRIASGQPYALRLDISKAMTTAPGPLTWQDFTHGTFTATPQIYGDVVLARKDTPASYHVAVVVDDALQGITLVTRGEDLLPATHLHRLLQALLNLPTPQWQHHRLITNAAGVRLAKRDNALSLRHLRESGWTAERVKQEIGCLPL